MHVVMRIRIRYRIELRWDPDPGRLKLNNKSSLKIPKTDDKFKIRTSKKCSLKKIIFILPVTSGAGLFLHFLTFWIQFHILNADLSGYETLLVYMIIDQSRLIITVLFLPLYVCLLLTPGSCVEYRTVRT